jgi:hypothetical protein
MSFLLMTALGTGARRAGEVIAAARAEAKAAATKEG